MVNSFEEKVFGEGLSEELRLLFCGRRERNYAHRYPPHRNDRYILTLVVGGEAEMTVEEGRKIPLKKGCFYAIFPRSGAHYETRADLAWSIKWIVLSQWISFHGQQTVKPLLYYPKNNRKLLGRDVSSLPFAVGRQKYFYLHTEKKWCISVNSLTE